MSELPRASRLKARGMGSLIVAFPCLLYSVVAFCYGDPFTGRIALCAGATAIALYLTIVCFVFVDDFVEMGIPVFILSILFVILCPAIEHVWQTSRTKYDIRKYKRHGSDTRHPSAQILPIRGDYRTLL
jgi:hypothetical protein